MATRPLCNGPRNGHGDGPALTALLSQARANAHSSDSFVIDELVRLQLGIEPAALEAHTGVQVVLDAGSVAEVLTTEAFGLSNFQLHVRMANGHEALLLADPWDEGALAEVTARVGHFVEPMAVGRSVATVLRDRNAGVTPMQSNSKGATLPMAEGVVAFVDGALVKAYRDGASDLHFECDRTGVTAKLRLDGVMSTTSRLAGRQNAEEVISRIKVLAQLDITERRLPQDGRFRFAMGGTEIDLRVSIMPSVHGEDAVLRLLDKSHLRAQDNQVSLSGLGFTAADAAQIRRLANLPNGMVLVTGPTGSGKTTTVYAALSEINTGKEKIITIEDPVEYELPGVLQIPVNERKGLTFARGLRSILRHDPDRILVGEIRDAETAAIAVQSALTGHLVFTTVHANSLFDVIGRFRHFGIDMFGFVSSLNGVVVQRLMRQLCPHCVARRGPNADEQIWLDERDTRAADLPQATGCSACHQTGYRGRFVVAEVHAVTDSFRDLIMRNVDISELKRVAFASGVRPLIDQAMREVAQGRTTLEEVFRVVGQV